MKRCVLFVLALALVAASCIAGDPQALAADSHALVQGSGSGWSANAVNQWIADVQPKGLQVVFTASGSAQGRKDFGYRTNDFAVSEIGYRGTDPLTGESDTPQGREFAYLPIVSGGTAFPYQVKVKGELVRNLRLSGETLTKIFTNRITDWSDPAITADNNGRELPSLPVIPVVHSEGSGTTAHLTDYFDKQYPDLWRSFAGHAGFTEYYPRKGDAVAQSGSDGVMNFVASAAANGAIGYDEYSYALGKNYPVVKLENAAGFFSLPSQFNVAVSLTKALINRDKSSPDYLLQDLSEVYTFNDPRVYPISSYSYFVLPTGADDSKMTTAKRQTLADFLYYGICDGQKEMGPIGYSPLPVNLVTAGFEQVAKLREADPNVDLTSRDVSTCHNPTFIAGQPNRNYLAEVAPQPPACDQRGQGPCIDGKAAAARAGAATNASGTSGSSAVTARGRTAGAAGGVIADGVAADGSSSAVGTDGSIQLLNEQAIDAPRAVRPYRPGLAAALAPLAIALVLAIVAAPTLATRFVARRRVAS
ncbi:MAG: phosphate transport system substrate-binding protein [Actinomycetota bacterium]|jgi:ABC-type phosphate transport system substrate-binding protein